MSDARSFRALRAPHQELRDEATEILVSLQSKLDSLTTGPEEVQVLVHELRTLVEDIRRALD